MSDPESVLRRVKNRSLDIDGSGLGALLGFKANSSILRPGEDL